MCPLTIKVRVVWLPFFQKKNDQGSGLFWSLGGRGLPLKKFHQLCFCIQTQKLVCWPQRSGRSVTLTSHWIRDMTAADLRHQASLFSVSAACLCDDLFYFLINITNELMQSDMAFVHVYQDIQTGSDVLGAPIKSRFAVVILMVRDNADFRFACHTRATHSTLTVSQRSPVMLVGVPPEFTLISVQTVMTAKKKALASGSVHSSLYMMELKHRQQARKENLAYFFPHWSRYYLY